MKTKPTTLLALLFTGAVIHGADVILHWDWSGDERTLDKYRLLVDAQTDGTFEALKDQTNRVNGVVVKSIRYTIPNGETHAFRVVAVDDKGMVSEPSNRLIVEAPSFPPAPTGLKWEIVIRLTAEMMEP